jgi:hypothetical protein
MYIQKVFHKSFCGGNSQMYVLHENTCVYEIEMESFLRDL